jgi:hypothetical protein
MQDNCAIACRCTQYAVMEQRHTPMHIYTHIGDNLFSHTTVVYIYFFSLISNPLTISVPDKDHSRNQLLRIQVFNNYAILCRVSKSEKVIRKVTDDFAHFL